MGQLQRFIASAQKVSKCLDAWFDISFVSLCLPHGSRTILSQISKKNKLINYLFNFVIRP